MNTLRLLSITFGLSAVVWLGPMACSDDSTPNPAAVAGGSGGQGGTTGNGGSAGNSTGGSAGHGGSAPAGVWKPGVVGKADHGAIVLAKNAGQIQGLAISRSMKPMDLPLDGGEDADLDADQPGGVPDTVPAVDLSGITPDFTEIWFPVQPYKKLDSTKIAPLTAVLKSDGTVTTVSHFADWETQTDIVMDCFDDNMTFEVTLNGNQLKSYGGLSLDMADCMGRHFLVSNASDKVWELFADGTKSVLADQLPGASAIMCHPEGYLLVTTLPQFVKNAPNSHPVQGVRIHKLALDGSAPSQLAELPVTMDYITPGNVPTCWKYPFTDKALPAGLRLPITLDANGDLLVGDVGARKIYRVTPDGQSITAFADMPMLTASAILAPNGIVYLVDAPLLDKTGQNVLSGTTIRAFNGTDWVDVIALTGYEQYINAMSWGKNGVPCPPQFADAGACLSPWGVFTKITYGATAILYLVDPIKGEFIAIPLTTEDQDAGTGGSGDEAGSSGAGGSSGEGGSSGDGGSAGGSGEGGSAGSGGDGGSSGSSGTGGDGGSGGDGDASAD